MSIYDQKGSIITDKKQCADLLNVHFNTIAEQILTVPHDLKDDGVICTAIEDWVARIHEEYHKEFCIPEITVENILLYYKHILRQNCASGADGIPAWIVKEYIEEIAPMLCQLYNRSITENKYPEVWKIMKKVAIFKSGRKCADNFRPITILDILAKSLDYHVYVNLVHYFTVNGLLYKRQAGGVGGGNTEHMLLATQENILKGTEDKQECSLMSYDCRKAFDLVRHDLLLP